MPPLTCGSRRELRFLTNEQVVCALYDGPSLHAWPPCLHCSDFLSLPFVTPQTRYPGETRIASLRQSSVDRIPPPSGLHHRDFDSTGVHPLMMDDSNDQIMPYGALVVSIPIMILSAISLALSLLWFTMQHYHSERWSCTPPSWHTAAQRNDNANRRFRCGFDGTGGQWLHDGEHRATVLVRNALAA